MRKKLLTFLALLTVIFALPQAASAAIYVGGYNGSWTFNSNNQMTQVGTSTIYYFRAEKSKLYQKTFKIVENGNTYYGLPASGNYWIGTFDEQELSTDTQDLYFKENTYNYYDIIYNSNDHKFIIRPSICIYYWGGSSLSNKETELYMTPSTLSTYTYTLGNVTATTSDPLNILIKVKGVWDQRWGISGAITPNANAVSASHYGNVNDKETKLQTNVNNAVVTFTAPSSLSDAGEIQITGAVATPAPTMAFSPDEETHNGTTLDVTMTPSNATSWTYTVTGKSQQSVSNGNSKQITIGNSSATSNQSITINWTATGAGGSASGSKSFTLNYVTSTNYTVYLDYSETSWSTAKLHIWGNDITDQDLTATSIPGTDRIVKFTFTGTGTIQGCFFNGAWNNQNQSDDISSLTDGALYKVSGGSSSKKHSVTTTNNYTPPTLPDKLTLSLFSPKSKDYTLTNDGSGLFSCTIDVDVASGQTFKVHGPGASDWTYDFGGGKSVSSPNQWSSEGLGTGGSDATFNFAFKSGATFYFGYSDKKVKVEPKINVMMPLTKSDFNGKKHYFLIGDRTGDWRLLPEWEFKKVSNTQYEIDGRFFYTGALAIGVVDNYNDYIKHKCKMYAYTSLYEIRNNESLSIPLSYKYEMNPLRVNTETGPAQNDRMYFMIEGNDDNGKYQAPGTYVKKVTLTLNSSGIPTNVAFTRGSEDDAIKNRMFSLVGSAIYNKEFCNSKGEGNTHLYNAGINTSEDKRDGWQEGWIQYDSITKKPFVDGNGEFLYHTSFTPNYLGKNKTYFDNKFGTTDFQFTSEEVNFVESSQLKNLASDPYKDFYNSISGRNSVATSNTAKTGNGYNYKISVNGAANSSPQADWKCYVVKDMWMNGEFKIWSGWGGNNTRTIGSGNDGAHWYGPNGGPAGNNGSRTDVSGFDINAGKEVTLYRNVKNNDNVNYRLNKPTYFNRVILWYNTTDGIAGSFVQFIQETAGPAIFAQINGSNSKNIDYNWYLQNIDDSNSSDKVVKYTITRYRVSSEGNTAIGFPVRSGKSEEKVTIDYTVSQLSEANAPSHAETHNTDTGVVPGDGLSPGTYRYGIVITYSDGTTKSAISNPVTIYDTNNGITPQAVPMQLVELRQAAKDKYAAINNQQYMTYRKEENAAYYIMDRDANGKPVNVNQISSTIAQEILNNPEYYFWTSDYYVRCLDKAEFDKQIATRIDQGLIPDQGDVAIVPTLTVHDRYTIDNVNYNENRGTASLYNLGSKQYYATIFDRTGELSDANIQVTLSYSFTDGGNTITPDPSFANAGIDPVTPKAWGGSFEYEYLGNTNKGLSDEYADVLLFEVPSSVVEGRNVPVYINKNDLKPRQFDCIFKFNRPNVDREILTYYDILFDIDVITNFNATQTVKASGIYYDEPTSELNNDGCYSIRVHGVHPSAQYYPTLKVKKVSYERHDPNNPPVGDGFEAQWGNDLTVNAHVTSLKKPSTIEEVKLGYSGSAEKAYFKNTPNAALNGGWLDYINQPGFTTDGISWMYRGHKGFEDPGDYLIDPGETDNTDFLIKNKITNEPHWYLVETYVNDTDHASYAYLVKHQAGHAESDDTLLGKWIAHNFADDTTPRVVVTPVYIFNRIGSGDGIEIWDEDDNTVEIGLKNLGLGAPTGAQNKAPMMRAVSKTEKLDTSKYAVKIAGDNQPNVTSFAPGGSAYGELTASVGGPGEPGSKNTPTTGIESVRLDAGDFEPEYFNLQGIRVENPVKGQVYVVRRGAVVTKEVVR